MVQKPVIRTLFFGKPPNIRNASITIMLFSVILLVFFWTGLYFKVEKERQSEIANAFRDTANMARAFEEHSLRTIKTADQVALFIKHEYEQHGGNIDLLKCVSEGTFSRELFVLLSVIDEHGDLAVSSQNPFVPSNLQDREHFLVHKERDSGQAFVSKPVFGRSSGRWSIQITRRINKPDGSFNGVAVVSVDPFYFSKFYQQVNLGKNSLIALIGRDGIVRVRAAGCPTDLGQDVNNSLLMQNLDDSSAGQFLDTGSHDGVKRIYSYRVLSDYPLIVLVGVDEQEYMRAFFGRVRIYYWAGGIGTAVFLLFIVLLLNLLQRYKVSEETLRMVMGGLEEKIQERTRRLLTLNERLVAMNKDYALINKELTQTNQELEQSKEELLQRNNELNTAFKTIEQAQNRLIQQEKLVSIGKLAAGVAHEINNPLSFVTGNIEMLEQYFCVFRQVFAEYRKLALAASEYAACQAKVGEIEEIEREQELDYILDDLPELFRDTLDGLDRMNKIVKGMRFFAYSDKRHLFKAYDLNKGLEATLLVAQNEIKDYAFVEKNLGAIPAIQAISSEINQVLLNLIVNAVHAVKEKDIPKLGYIHISTWQEGPYVYCSIEDNGPGIAQESLHNIFEPFFTTKPAGQGTGLGLSISYEIIVNHHHGELLVENVPGRGAKFTVKLPVVQSFTDNSR